MNNAEAEFVTERFFQSTPEMQRAIVAKLVQDNARLTRHVELLEYDVKHHVDWSSDVAATRHLAAIAEQAK